MHYVVFLLRQGAVPYKQIIDINLPGTYAFEGLGMVAFGDHAYGLRLYDWSLMIAMLAGCVAFFERHCRFAGAFAGLLFDLVHLQDGIAQQGQRDLLLAVLMMWGFAAYGMYLRGSGRSGLLPFASGLAFGAGFTVKPVLLPLFCGTLAYGLYRWKEVRRPVSLIGLMAGIAIPLVATVLWLTHKGALGAFWAISRSLVPLHASLDRRPVLFLLTHSISPVEVLAAFGLCLMLIGRKRGDADGVLLLIAFAGTLFAFVGQGKGYPYQRYPFLAMLLLGIGWLVDQGLGNRRTGPFAAATCVLAGSLGLRYAWKATTYSITTPFQTALSQQLTHLGSPEQLSGQVQCLDTFGGCINTLFELGARQSTGFLYDCYLFTSPSAVRDQYRSSFMDSLQRTRPKVIVLSSQYCFADMNGGYERVKSWPDLATTLERDYHMVYDFIPNQPQKWFSRPQLPAGFRVLVRKSAQ